MYLFLDYNPSSDDVSYCLSDERLLIKEKGRFAVSDPRLLSLLHSALPITFDASAFFLSPSLPLDPFPLFDLKRLFRAYYGVREDITYSEAITQFDERAILANSPSFSFLLHFADFEGEEPSSLISQDYQDCFLSFPLHREAFIALNSMKAERERLLSAFEPEKVRKLLFFDLECANSDQGIGKICEFGSVTTDLDFNIVSECELLCNPDAPFRLGGRRGISLFHSSAEYEKAPLFPSVLPQIEMLLLEEGTLPIGFASLNDVRFIMGDCHRYGIKGPSFLSLDLQPLADRMLGSERSLSLEDALAGFGGDLPSGLTPHRALDDSKLTLEVAKRCFAAYPGGLLAYLKEKDEGFVSSPYAEQIILHPLPKLRYW